MKPPRQLVPIAEVPQHRPWIGSVKRLRNWGYSGHIAFHRVGGRIYIDLADIDDLAEAGRVEPAEASR